MPTVDWKVWQDADTAGRFAAQRRGGLLSAAEQFEVLIRLLRYVPTTPMAVLDLGCGDGIVLETVATAFAVDRAVALDGSAAMLGRARERLAELGSFGNNGLTLSLVEADFNDPGWTKQLPAGKYDAVVSAFAIHHSEDERKRALYAEIYALLNPGGVFVNIEHVASLSEHGEELFETAYAESLARHRVANGEAVTPEQVLKELQARPDKAANRLAPLEAQLEWLREISYVDVDCYWKLFELAVFAGYRAL